MSNSRGYDNGDFVEVVVAGKSCSFGRLDRHILYRAADGRLVSSKYPQQVVERVIQYLQSEGYLDDAGELTLFGIEAVEALMSRPR